MVLKSDGVTQNYFYLHRDYQGTILAITNNIGNIVEKRQFDPWGTITKIQDGNNNVLNKLTFFDRGYTGHEHLESVGLIHMNGRIYDPKLHRFLQPDNFVQEPYNTQNFNRYGYCLNNPLKYIDASGEEFLTAAIIAAVVAMATDITMEYFSGNGFSLEKTIIAGAYAFATSGIGYAINPETVTIGKAFLNEGFGLVTRFLPSIPIMQSESFNLSLKPTLGFGSSGFNFGGSLDFNGDIDGFAYGISMGLGSTSMSSLGESAGRSRYENWSVFLGYNDGEKTYGAGWGNNTYSGKTAQEVGVFTLQIGDFYLRIDEDYVGDHGDRSRTGGILATYKINDDLTLAYGISMTTGEATKKSIEDKELGNPKFNFLIHDATGEKNPTLRAGIMYGGVVYKGNATFIGSNSEKRLHSVQNWIHRRGWFLTEYFPDRKLPSKGFVNSGGFHPNYLFY